MEEYTGNEFDFEDDMENEVEFDEDNLGEDLDNDLELDENGDNYESSSYSEGASGEDDVDNSDEDKYADSDNLLNEEKIYTDNFISDTGDIVVMDDDIEENAFSLEYIDISNIILVKTIRKARNVNAMARTIRATGLISPIVVGLTATDGIYVLIDGFMRLLGCAKAGKKRVPCIINNKVSTKDIPIVTAMYNKRQAYTINEIVDYIEYLEKEKGIMNASMIEYLLQLNSGDYTKLKDILEDNDEDIVNKLYDGVFNIEQAFKKLEQRRKKETAEEREDRQAQQVYENAENNGMAEIDGTGESADGDPLSEEQIQNLTVSASDLDSSVEDSSIGKMIEDDNNIEGFKPHKQNVNEREYIDPAIRKATLARDNFTCACCKRGGEQYVDVLDFHHIVPVFLGGVDSVDNGIMLCVACHRLVHLYSTGDLHIDAALMESDYESLDEVHKMRYPNEQIYEDEKMRFKRIIKLGSVIRKGIAEKGMSREQYKKEHSNAGIGRRKPGVNAPQERA